jgi:uncharacterized protein DUF1565/parallel beta helix pectate lyase-like protein
MRLHPTPRALLIAACALATPAIARAQNGSTPGALQLYPTFHALGARLPYTGDANGNATARLEWRPSGAATWTAGVAMTRITASRWAGSVLWLAPDTPYEVRAVIDDPDGGATSAPVTLRTRHELPATPLRTLWVATTGNDANPGSSSQPLRTLQAAANLAQAGDQIRVRPGIYRETVDAVRSGTDTAPIQLVADQPGVIVDGSDPAYLSRTDWRADGGGVYSVPFAATTRLVCADSTQRLYHQATLADLQANANAVAQGWTVSAGRLYVKLEDGSSPNGHVMHVARLDNGVILDVSDWRVSGLEVRYFGVTSAASGIYLVGATGCEVSGNYVHTIGGKNIYLRVGAADNLIQANVARDPRIGSWPWAACKAHEEEQQGISNRGGRGNVIRSNTVHGTFDGIDAGGSDTDENVGADMDIDDNTITGVGDDAMEPEGMGAINVRVWRNRIDDVFSGMSTAPVYQGPMYILYNTFTNYRRGGLKLSLSGVGELWFVHNTLTSSVSGTPAVHPSGPYSNVHWRNNIMVGNGAGSVSDDAGESGTGCDFNGDLLFSNYPALFRWKGINYGTLAALRSATGFEAAGRSGDPMFMLASAGDYRLRAGSPAIDGALRMPGINDVFLGAAPDMGAWEFTPGGDVTPPNAITDLR